MKTSSIKTFSERLHQNTIEKLEAIALENMDVIIMASESIQILKLSLLELKSFVHQYQFKDIEEEVTFFKEIKPKFTSQYYFYERILALKIDEPAGSGQDLLPFYYQELNRIKDFTKRYLEFHGYCLTNATYLDHQYFTREYNFTRSPDTDEKFSTAQDNTLSVWLANKMLREYLLSAIKKVELEGNCELKPSLTWTGPKTSLIELIYALQSAQVFNNGKSDIKQIASSLEQLFNISLGNYYRGFQDLRLRKSGMTNFLDQLKDKFIQRINELDQN